MLLRPVYSCLRQKLTSLEAEGLVTSQELALLRQELALELQVRDTLHYLYNRYTMSADITPAYLASQLVLTFAVCYAGSGLGASAAVHCRRPAPDIAAQHAALLGDAVSVRTPFSLLS